MPVSTGIVFKKIKIQYDGSIAIVHSPGFEPITHSGSFHRG